MIRTANDRFRFLVTAGTERFHAKGHPDIDAKVGDLVVVLTRAPHTFSNPFDETKFFNPYTRPYTRPFTSTISSCWLI